EGALLPGGRPSNEAGHRIPAVASRGEGDDGRGGRELTLIVADGSVEDVYAIGQHDLDVRERLLRAPEREDAVGGVDAVDANLLQRPALKLARQLQTAQAGHAAELERAVRVDIGVRTISRGKVLV